MKKGIVMEKHRQFTIVMTNEGEFHKAKPIQNAIVGAEVSYELLEEKKQFLYLFHPRKRNNPIRIVAMACMLLIVVMPFYFISDSKKTYAYVNIDINPSVEIEVDDDLHVQSILPLNDDAKDLINELTKYQGESLDEVLSEIMDKSEKNGLIKNGKNVLVGVSYVDGTHKKSVLNIIDNYFLKHQKDWETVTFQVPKEIRKKAKAKEKSMNELMVNSLVENNTVEGNAANSVEKDLVNDEEKAIIDSFYNNKAKVKAKENKQRVNETAADEKNSTYENQHPSELKGKNGEIHSNKNNNGKKANKGKRDITKEKKHNKAKHHNKRDKTKDKHDHNQKHKHKDDHANEHKHKYNHGNNKHNHGKNKDKHNRGRGNGKQENKPKHPHK